MLYGDIMPLVTGLNFAPGVLQTMDDNFLAVQRANLIHGVCADLRHMPARGGTTLRLPRLEKFPTFPVPLDPSGAPVPSIPVVRTDHDATISFFGQSVAINQRVILQNQEDVLYGVSENLGISMRETEDLLIRSMLSSTSSVYTCVAGGNGDNPTDITQPDIDEVTTRLMANDAIMIMDHIEGEDRLTKRADVKFSLIDLEALSGDRAQA